ncbi:MAG: serine/threonine-protein kinase, partial [Candidatus Promineifilaceae bacterium]|nr:serine/threonine-protein kinase [Candidatus Promineifilaceae bacterium]
MASDVSDRYQILEKIGAGGMGTVYRAWDREIEREVALKWLPGYFSQDEHFTERFKREARVVARLEHPHIVPIYDVGENEGRPFIIMRLLDGGTLREQIGKPRFDLAALIKALEEIGDALTAAHARQIIHRDIKPGNILFDEHGSAFLSDFGIAKVLDSATQLTGSGFIGTPAYMSPEQFIGQDIDGRSDQYALAIVVYETLTGSLPFQGNTAQMMYKHINASPPDIDLEEHPIPRSFNPVLQKALAKDPAERYARILDFTTALRVALRQDPAAAALPLAAGIGLVPTPQKPATAATRIDTPPEEQKTDLLQKEYRDGLEAMSRSQWAIALSAFNRVLEADPHYGNAAEFKAQAQANLDQAAVAAVASEAATTVDPDTDSSGADKSEDGILIAGAAALGLAAAGAAASAAAEPVDAPAEAVEASVEAPGDLDETSLDLPTGAIAAAGASLVEPVEVPAAPVEEVDDLEKTSLDLPTGAIAAAGASLVEPAEAPAAPVEEVVDLEKTNLDLPTGAIAAAGAAAALTAQPDLEKTSLDLPTGAAEAADLEKTSLDLPPGAYAAAVGAAGTTPELDSTSLDLPTQPPFADPAESVAAPTATVAAGSTAAPSAQPVAEPVAARNPEGIELAHAAHGAQAPAAVCAGRGNAAGVVLEVADVALGAAAHGVAADAQVGAGLLLAAHVALARQARAVGA